MSRALVFLPILIFAGSGPALAEDAGDDYARDGIYVSVRMAGTWLTALKEDVQDAVDALSAPPFPSTELEKPLGLNLIAGYRFLPHLAAEAQFEWFGNANVALDNGDNSTDILKVETLNFSGNLKGYLLTGRVQPFVLAGAGLMHANGKDKLLLGIETNGDAFAARFGGGIDLYINEHFVIVGEGGYLLPTGKLDHLKQVVWSAGLQYRF